ncbi:MAG: DUF1127 domain-containing protein [Rhizobiaceae bacterium]|nr:DUF1127 domain-containing protein [Rhizobiaceae bacterium]
MGILNVYRNWRKYRRTTRMLRGMPDHILNDIGVNRREIGRHHRQIHDI